MQEKNINIYELDNKINRTRRQVNIIIILLIILIIILLIFGILGYKIGKIGYKEVSTGVNEPDVDIINVTENDIKINKDTQLNIFNNKKFDENKIIAPHSKGTYKFCVKNQANRDITYNIKLEDQMKYLINMKYKLKIDNIYIRGNENTYVSINELNVNDIIVMKDSNNIYSLEWYWEDDNEKDTYIGSLKTDEYYTLKLKIQSKNYEK